jgi:endonuclease/exonuclease/phosphatase family metal-dependent hydrolase
MRFLKTPKAFVKAFLCTLLFLSGAEAWCTSFSVVSLNTWGVPFVVKDTFRYSAAMSAIEKINPDFVFLEELFSAKGRKDFQSPLYPYVVNGPHAWPRITPGGIRLLSKYPVISSAKMAFSGCEGDDCLSKKGALLAVVKLPDGQLINLVGTHLNARGDDSVRENQVEQLVNFIQNFADPTAPTLISGDFNYGPTSPAYPYALAHLGVKDAWTELHPASDLGITYDPVGNQYAHDYCIAHNFPLDQDRIDLNLIKGAGLTATSNSLIFNDPSVPFVSDHYGVYSAYELVTD